jgi:hypothetical protein
VRRDWSNARAWLGAAMSSTSSPPAP